jgi:predicted Zn-dependent protease
MDSSQHQIDRAMSLLELGRDDEAAQILQEVMVADPTNAHALGLLSRTYRRTNPPYAYQLALQAVGLNPVGSGLHLNAAWAADAAKRPTDAVAHAREVVRLDPHWSEGYQALAQLLVDVKKGYIEGQMVAAKGIELAPEDPDAWVARGNVALAASDTEDARRSYQHALSLEPQHKTALLNIALLNERSGKVGSAIHVLQSIVRLDPRDPEARIRIDDLAVQFLDHMLGLAVAVGVTAAFVLHVVFKAN